MKHKCFVVLGILALSLFAISQSHAYLIDLGKAGDFGLLGGASVTNAGNSIVNNGSVGSAPTSTVTGFPPGVVNNGTLYTTANGATAQAHTDLGVAYQAAKNASGGVTGPADLGGATLSPGVYTWATVAPWTAGTLTLNALGNSNAQWIFQIGSTLTTPTGASVVLSNGASANNVFWQVGSSATIGSNNLFAGNIMADQSITLGGGTLAGRALALNGTVSITADETVNAPEPSMMYTLVMVGVAGLALFRRRMKLDGRS